MQRALDGVVAERIEAPSAEVTALAAEHLLRQPGLEYQLGARGPTAFDGYTFVVHVVGIVHAARQRVLDQAPTRLPVRARAAYRLAMPSGGRTPADEVPVEPDASDLEEVLVAAGMIAAGICTDRPRRGDIVLSLGHGPAGAIALTLGANRSDDLVAMAWNEAPRLRANHAIGRSQSRIYRWPEAQS